mmetsp:Transcript_34155/g.108352  ORF Transcript_34155/g.108352 Transcript_34155/m.108352 type:complete len:315 (+) Transcript_34155:67-1011(+)
MVSPQAPGAPLRTPLVERREGVAKPGWLQFAASHRCPEPTVILLVLFAMMSFACIVDHAGQSTHASSPAQGADMRALDLGSSPVVSTPPLGTHGRPTLHMMVLMGMAVSVAWLVACQCVVDLVFKKAFLRALRALDVSKLGLVVESGPMRSCFFLGRLELRNCILRNPCGYESEDLLHVRTVSANFDILSILRSLGSEITIRDLQLDGVTVVVEKHMGSHAAEDLSNIEDVLVQLGKSSPAVVDKQKFSIRKVVVTGLSANVVGGMHTPVSSIRYNDFSAETGVQSMDRAALMLLTDIGKAAIASLGRISREIS